jgi:hypothetical protein
MYIIKRTRTYRDGTRLSAYYVRTTPLAIEMGSRGEARRYHTRPHARDVARRIGMGSGVVCEIERV